MNSFMNALHALNVMIQSFLNLLTPIGLALLVSFLLVEKAGAPSWLYALFVTLGVLSGFYSMIRFILRGMGNLERLEKEQQKRKKQRKGQEK